MIIFFAELILVRKLKVIDISVSHRFIFSENIFEHLCSKKQILKSIANVHLSESIILCTVRTQLQI